MVQVSALKRLMPLAWTALLTGQFGKGRHAVVNVREEPLGKSKRLSRFLLDLQDYREPITLIGKNAELPEARFYRELAPGLSFITPDCWFSHSERRESWIVFEEIYNDYPFEKWVEEDVDAVINALARLHTSFWAAERMLKRHGMKLLLDPQVYTADRRGRAYPWPLAQDLFSNQPIGERPEQVPDALKLSNLSEHTVRSAGRLAPIFAQAASGLDLIRGLGGWPGVIDEEQLTALGDLIEDPLPMLYPLRLAPMTLLHGRPGLSNWCLSMFGDIRLLDWKDVCIGPAVLDLVALIEDFDRHAQAMHVWEEEENWSIIEETLEDSYILAAGKILGSRFDATDFRQLIPPARCFHTLMRWLPQLADWFRKAPANRDIWLKFNRLTDDELAEIGFSDMVGIRPYLARSFKRFLQAYRML